MGDTLNIIEGAILTLKDLKHCRTLEEIKLLLDQTIYGLERDYDRLKGKGLLDIDFTYERKPKL